MIHYIQTKFPYYSQTFVQNEVNYFKQFEKIHIYTLYPVKIHYFFSIFSFNNHKFYIFLQYLFKILTKTKSFKELIFYIYALFYAFYIEKYIKKDDIVRVHLPKFNGFVGMIISKLKIIKFIPVFHSYALFTHNPFLKEICKNAHYIETISEYNKKYLQNIINKNIKIFHCGIDFNSLPQVQKKGNFAIFVGRLHPTKGISTVIKLFSNLPYEIIFIGGGNIKKYKKMAKKNNVNAIFLGKLSHKKALEYIGKAKLLVLPAQIDTKTGDRDGIPVVLMEAMALRTPVLTRKISGIPELVIENKTGFIFNTISEGKKKINKIFNNYPNDIINNAYKLVKNSFNNEILFDKKRNFLK